MQQLRFASRLAAPAPPLWAQRSTMHGVNEELLPIMSMPRLLFGHRQRMLRRRFGTLA